MKNQNNDTYSLAHTTWKCQYHIVFTPKYHRKIIYGALRAEIGKILRELCKRKGVEIIEAHAMPDHIHMLVSIPPNEKVSSFMGYLKGKSTMIIFERYAHLKYKYGNRHFWSRGYYVSTVTYFYGHYFQGGKNFAPLLALLRFIVKKAVFMAIFASNLVIYRKVRVQSL